MIQRRHRLAQPICNRRRRHSPCAVPGPPPRGGVVLVVVLACLAACTILWASLVRICLVADRQAQSEQLELQASWLAQSAIDRAVAQLERDPEFTTEMWPVDSEQLGTRLSGTATIDCETVD